MPPVLQLECVCDDGRRKAVDPEAIGVRFQVGGPLGQPIQKGRRRIVDEEPLAPVREHTQASSVPGHEEKELGTKGLGGTCSECSKVIDVGRAADGEGSTEHPYDGVV